MIRPVSLFWLSGLLVRGFHYGMFAGVTPLIGTGDVGWSEAHITGVVGTAPRSWPRVRGHRHP